MQSSVPIELYKPQLDDTYIRHLSESSVPIELYKPQPGYYNLLL